MGLLYRPDEAADADSPALLPDVGWIVLVVSAALASACLTLAWFTPGDGLGGRAVCVWLAAIVGGGLAHFGRSRYWVRLDRRTCADCGYDLRGAHPVEEPRCPECGGTSIQTYARRRSAYYICWAGLLLLATPTVLLILRIGAS